MSPLHCRDSFLMQREISQIRFICYAASQRKRGKPRPFSLSAIRYSCQLELLPKKEPNSWLGQTPPELHLREECWRAKMVPTDSLQLHLPAPVLNLGTSTYAKITTLKINVKRVLKSCPMDTNPLTLPSSWKSLWDTSQQQQGEGGWYKDEENL